MLKELSRQQIPIPTTVDRQLYEEFSSAAATERVSVSQLLADLMRDFIDNQAHEPNAETIAILGFCFVVVAGGSDTTASLISHGIAQLTHAPDQRQLLLEDPSLIGNALIEFLRRESSVQGLCRITTRPMIVQGVTIPAGEKVLMMYAAANRDPREFGPTADELDVRREIPRHLAFSSGPHFCIGSHLARLMARVAFEELLAAHPQVCVDTAAGERHRSAFVRGWVSLPAYGPSLPAGSTADRPPTSCD